MNDLVLQNNDVVFTQGDVVFNGYETLMEQAQEVAEYIQNIIVTEDNIKDVKKVLATSNKTLKELNDRRIQIKKELMKPYDEFARQIKEIESVVDEANEVVKSKVRDLEEIEREEKREALEQIWHDKTQTLPYKYYITFDVFFKDQYLNKSFSVKKFEEELDEFIEKTQKDIEYLKTKDPEYLTEYLNVFNLQEALTNIDKHKEMLVQIENEEDDEIVVGEVEEVGVFEIKGKANIKLIEMLLNENEIKFRRIK